MSRYDQWDEEWAATLKTGLGYLSCPISRQLDQLPRGNTIEVISFPVIPSLENGTSRQVEKAWLKVVEKEASADPVANAAWSVAGGMLRITTTNVVGVGQILNAVSPQLRFDLTAANTAQLVARRIYYFEAQVLMSDGAIYAYERGVFLVEPGLITATS